MPRIIGEFRTICPEYVSYIASIKPTHKQQSMFVTYLGRVFKGVKCIDELLNMEDDTLVFHTWPGKYSSDVFHYKLGDIRKNLIEKLASNIYNGWF